MKMKIWFFIISITLLFSVVSCQNKTTDQPNKYRIYAQQTLDSLYKFYSTEGTDLLRETYPYDDTYKATYLANEEQSHPNEYSFLWPYSGTFSAVNILLNSTQSDKYKKLLDNQVLPGLQSYFDQARTPHAYSSYINTLESDRFYDDNIWLGIDFVDTFAETNEKKYLDKALSIWEFVWSGADDQLGGGIYWCEQNKSSKNTCSNAPASVLALKLFSATADSTYFKKGQFLYLWTKENLQDPSDKTFFDNIRLDGSIDKAKYAYNSGQMLQAACLLYNLTHDQSYLKEAEDIAFGTYNRFFQDFTGVNGKSFKMIKKGDIWFTAVMLRGFVELYHLNGDTIYLNSFASSLDYAWKNARDKNGLFNADLKGIEKDNKKWLLTQAAIVEMYARLSTVKLEKAPSVESIAQ